MSTTASLGTSLLDMGSRKATLATVRDSLGHTLREQTSAYKRVMDPALGMEKDAPTSNRICQVIRKFILTLTGIRDARGICVQGLGSRAGHRAAAANGQVQRGGKREKKVATEGPLFHSDVAETRLRLIAASRERHTKK